MNTGVGSRSLLQGIFPTQGWNPGLPHCRWILYQLSHQGSPWTDYGRPNGLQALKNRVTNGSVAGPVACWDRGRKLASGVSGGRDGGSPSHAAPLHTHCCLAPGVWRWWEHLAIPLHPFPLRRCSSQSGHSLSWLASSRTRRTTAPQFWGSLGSEPNLGPHDGDKIHLGEGRFCWTRCGDAEKWIVKGIVPVQVSGSLSLPDQHGAPSTAGVEGHRDIISVLGESCTRIKWCELVPTWKHWCYVWDFHALLPSIPIHLSFFKYKEKKIKCIDHIWATVSTSCERQKENLEVLMLLKLLRKEHTSWHVCLENGDWRVEGVKIGAEKGFIRAPQFTSRLRETKRDFFSGLG